MLSILRYREFRLLWIGQFVSILGDMILYTALPFYVYQVTGSALATGIMFMVETIPHVLLGSVAGVFVDRWDRRKIMIAVELSSALILLPLLLIKHTQALWILYVVGFIQSLLSMFFRPAKNALLPNLIGKDELVKANSLFASTHSIGLLLGPPLGGALLGWLKLTGVTIIDSVTFLFSALMIFLMAAPAAPESQPEEPGREVKPAPGIWGELKEGLRIIRGDNLILSLFILIGLGSIAHGIIGPMFVVFIKKVLGGNAFEFGLVGAFEGIGCLMGSFLLSKSDRQIHPTRLVMAGYLGGGALVAFLGHTRSISTAFILILFLGLFFVACSVSERTLIQVNVEDRHRGKVFGALNSISYFSILIGLAVSSFLGDKLGSPLLFTMSGLITVAGGFWAMYSLWNEKKEISPPPIEDDELEVEPQLPL